MDCPKHSGKQNVQARKPLDDIMYELPNNQSGAGRHKCPYCAYEAGFKAGKKKRKKRSKK